MDRPPVVGTIGSESFDGSVGVFDEVDCFGRGIGHIIGQCAGHDTTFFVDTDVELPPTAALLALLSLLLDSDFLFPHLLESSPHFVSQPINE